jgi:topoisomerase-4 subunit A
VQADAILNLRLKALSKLEEIEIKAEHDRLTKERKALKSLLKSEEEQWERVADEVRATREAYSKRTALGKRRSDFADAPVIEVDLDQALIEKEPITVILSEKGWIRAMKGHQDDLSKLEFKQGDALMRAAKAYTTDKLLLLATNGKVFTLAGDQLPGGRGHGEPVRLMVDLEENHAFAEIWVHTPGRRLLVAATSGHGFVVPEDEMVAMTRKGKQIVNVTEPDEARIAVPADGDTVAVIGENRKMLIFPLAEVNEMARGKGVYLQRYKDGALSDVRVFRKAAGLTWLDPAGRTFTLPISELKEWLGERAQAGRMAPRGFPKSNKFGRSF